jgi:hypothetical protein
VVIEGFKSYKDQVISEPFSSGINIIGERVLASCAPTPDCLLGAMRGARARLRRPPSVPPLPGVL